MGLAGKIWQQAKPIWVKGLQIDQHCRIAERRATQTYGSNGFPIISNEQV